MSVYPGPGDGDTSFARPGEREVWRRADPVAGPAQRSPGESNPMSIDRNGPNVEEIVPIELQLAFAPLHKRAFGIAVGTACALAVFALTLFHLLLDPSGALNLPLLSNYFYGYSVSWRGLAIGTGWGFAVGFVLGWFTAFCRNLVIAISFFVTRTRAELKQTRDFLDHI